MNTRASIIHIEILEQGGANIMCVHIANEKEILKHFDSIFNTDTVNNVKFDDMKLLKAIFDYFDNDIYNASQEYEKLRKEHNRIETEFEDTLTYKQKEMYDKCCEIKCSMTVEQEQQLFLFGYIVAKELNIESTLSRD